MFYRLQKAKKKQGFISCKLKKEMDFIFANWKKLEKRILCLGNFEKLIKTRI